MTPPTSGEDGELARGAVHLAKGRATIDRDVKRQFQPVLDTYIAKSDSRAGKAIRSYAEQGATEKLATIIHRLSGKKIDLIPQASAAIHDAHRSARSGKPNKRFIVMDEASVASTSAAVQKRVGHGKSGWLQSLADLRAAMPRGGFAWVRMASKRASGFTVIDKTPNRQSVTVANAAPHGENLRVTRKTRKNIIERAIELRASKMSKRLEYLLRQPKVTR